MSKFLLFTGGLTLAATLVATAQAPVPSAVGGQPVTFHKDVLPILQRSCQSCHRPGQIGPMPLLTYQQARPWARAIKTQVAQRSMPPWHADPRFGHFLNDRSLKDTEIAVLLAWADGGALEGDSKDAPPPVQWPADGWLVQPDVVVTLPDYQVPATGTVEWENLAVRSPFAEDTWITSIEILPSDPSTVHHMCFDFQTPRPNVVLNQYEWGEVPRDETGAPLDRRGPPDARTPPAPNREVWTLTRDVGSTEVKRRQGRPTLAAGGTNCYVPGMSLHDYRPFGAGRLVRGGENMVFNLHYQTGGQPKTNRVRVGFTVAKERPLRKFIALTPTGATAGFAIPPNESNYRAPEVSFTVNKAAQLVWMSPHMHFRGKDMTWSLRYPTGRSEVVLSVPRYQYLWQLQYQTNVAVPAGTRVQVEAHYDNSAGNKANPNPNTWVYPGNQAWEEMMVPFTWFVVDVDVDEKDFTTRFTQADGA